MKAGVSLVIMFLTVVSHFSGREPQENAPQVKFITPDAAKTYTWNEQVRYSFNVSDPQDGDSKYGEIASTECSLTITYLPGNREADINQIKNQKDDPALVLMKRSNCFGCHAHKSKLAGPSFEEISKRYKNDAATIKSLSGKILNGSIGVWGDQQMPAHEDLNEEQCRQISAYIIKIGGDAHRWIFPGLEGTFRIMEKPSSDPNGTYVLTGGYTSKAGKNGTNSMVLRVR